MTYCNDPKCSDRSHREATALRAAKDAVVEAAVNADRNRSGATLELDEAVAAYLALLPTTDRWETT